MFAYKVFTKSLFLIFTFSVGLRYQRLEKYPSRETVTTDSTSLNLMIETKSCGLLTHFATVVQRFSTKFTKKYIIRQLHKNKKSLSSTNPRGNHPKCLIRHTYPNPAKGKANLPSLDS